MAIATRLRGTRATMYVVAAILLGAGAWAASGNARGPVQLAGIPSILLALTMLAARQYAVPSLIAALLVINGTYQHVLKKVTPGEPHTAPLCRHDEGRRIRNARQRALRCGSVQ